MNKKIYYAGPLFCKSEKDYNESVAKLLEQFGYAVFLPQRDGIEAAQMQGKSAEQIADEIFRKDTAEIMQADIFFMNLDGRVPDDGACVELGIAYASGKRCYGLKTDTRALEIGLDLNPLISGCFKQIFRNQNSDEAIQELSDFLRENQL